MPAIGLRLRSELRTRWLTWLVLATMIGVLGGVILTSISGARRTASVHDRFLTENRAWDAMTIYAAFDPTFAQLHHDEVSKLGSVAEGFEAALFETDGDVDVVGWPDAAFGRTFNAATMVEGRLPDLDAIDEVSFPYERAQALGLNVGDRYEARFRRIPAGDSEPSPFDVSFRIVGTHVMPGDFPPGTGDQFSALSSPAFHRANADLLFAFGFGLFRLHGGVDSVPDFRQEIEALADGKFFIVMSQKDQIEIADDALGLLAIAMWVLAGVLLIVWILVFGQTLARQATLDSEGFTTIRALGMTGGQLLAIGLVRATVIGLAAGLVAAIAAIALSPLTPAGIARLIEPEPGISLDLAVLLPGGLAVATLCVLLSLLPLWRAERHAASPASTSLRRSRIARMVFRAGGSPSMVSGVRLALERGRGSGSVPVLTTIGAAAAGLGSVLMAVTFAASLDHLLEDPAVYGIRWDNQVNVNTDGGRGENNPALAVAERIRGLEGVETAAVMDMGIPFEIDGVSASGIAIDPAHRDLGPALIDGRDPAGSNEILLGERTLQRLGASIGDSVSMGIAGLQAKSYEIVGTAALPGYGTDDLGEGTLVLPSALLRLAEDPPPPSSIYMRFQPSADIDAALGTIRGFELVTGIQERPVPSSIRNLDQVRGLPSMLAMLLGLVAIAAIAHALVSSVRRRARELAVLRALGFVRGQVRTTIAWQAVTLVAVAMLVGIPAGIVAGRGLWAAAADRLGINFLPQTPADALMVVIPGALLLALLVSSVPARRAVRTDPAVVLRVEQ